MSPLWLRGTWEALVRSKSDYPTSVGSVSKASGASSSLDTSAGSLTEELEKDVSELLTASYDLAERFQVWLERNIDLTALRGSEELRAVRRVYDAVDKLMEGQDK